MLNTGHKGKLTNSWYMSPDNFEKSFVATTYLKITTHQWWAKACAQLFELLDALSLVNQIEDDGKDTDGLILSHQFLVLAVQVLKGVKIQGCKKIKLEWIKISV